MNFFDRIHRLPLHLFGLKNIPGVPVVPEQWPQTLVSLFERGKETLQAKQGLTSLFTIDGNTNTAYEYMYSSSYEADKEVNRQYLQQLTETNIAGALSAFLERILHDKPPLASVRQESLNMLALEKPEQFSMSWTSWTDINEVGKPYLETWANSLRPDNENTVQAANGSKGASAANDLFWPMIAEYGLAYNLLVLQKYDSSNAPAGKNILKGNWLSEYESYVQQGILYFIDMTIFNGTQPQVVNGTERFTPGTYTVLKQDAISKKLTPVSIVVSGYQGAGEQIYTYDQEADDQTSWLYALQAAKTSITVHGIWLGHVYQMHIVSAAMQMTLYNNIPEGHPINLLLQKQSNYLMAFDNILLLLWGPGTTPPTSITTAYQFLQLINQYAGGRQFHDDDPEVALAKNGIKAADFTTDPADEWNAFPIARQMLLLKTEVNNYVEAFVADYFTDDSVANDKDIQNWIADSSSTEEGNIAGLPQVKDKATLASVLASLIYRILVHGVSRLSPSSNPALTFSANFPPCLQNSHIPAPGSPNVNILNYLPHTGTIGEYMDFGYIFVFSAPYEPFLPLAGNDSNLFFGDDPAGKSNQALVTLRNQVFEFLTVLYARNQQQPQPFQWPLNIET